MAKHYDLPHAGRALSPSSIDVGHAEDGRVKFTNWRGEADRPEPAPAAPLPPDQRVGFAIAGLGRLALGQILPAFAACTQAIPVALISGTPEKARTVAAQYGIAPDHVLGYGEMARLRDLPRVQAVYIVTPNGVHLETIQAVAGAGKHILCEKPMANTSAEATEMVSLCDAAKVKLMVAYRCQYEPYNRHVMALVRNGALGKVRLIEAANMQVQGPLDQWRLKAPLAGGGALPDIGLYCLNGVRAMLAEEPCEVFARIFSPAGDARYAEVEETITFMLRFPSGAVANCAASYGAHESKNMALYLEKGRIEFENAFAYQGQRLRIAHRDGAAEAVDEVRLAQANQFALEIDHFADCILHGKAPRTPGSEGVKDQVIMEAIYRAARDGQPVGL
jgi:predicted dehydrogenase